MTMLLLLLHAREHCVYVFVNIYYIRGKMWVDLAHIAYSARGDRVRSMIEQCAAPPHPHTVYICTFSS